MKILLFGTGDYYNRYKKWFEQQEVLALLDNSQKKQHTVINGLEVLSPAEGIGLNYDVIIILSFYVKQMKQQLLSLGVDGNKIYHFYDLHWLLAGKVVLRPIQYYLDADKIAKDIKTGKAKILLMSHDLALGGPAIALFHAAIVLQKYGYVVVYASMMDGPLREKLIENDIAVILDENIQIATMQETEWVDGFSAIICNTLNFYVFLSKRDTRIPIIWWLHDAAFFYEGVNEEIISKISRYNLKTASVGPVPEKAIKKFLPDIVCDELLYGVADMAINDMKSKYSICDYCQGRNSSDVIHFITIGFLEARKGQDILLRAIQKLPEHVRRSSIFYIVGHEDTLFGEQIRAESAGIGEIIFMGSVGRKKIHELLDSTDILICPSRQDPMPTVVAEAMMHSVPCIVSDVIGTAAYIHSGEDGFIFPNEDAQMLAEKIEWCVKNRDRLECIGKKSRKLYDKYFSMTAFEKHFMRLIDDVLVQK